MSVELFQATTPAVQSALAVYLFGDGEVLLNVPRHLAMTSRVYQENPQCELGFSTNGSLLTPEVYELYAIAGIDYIQVSVDAASKDLYETMRRGGSFDALNYNLEGIAAWRRRSRMSRPELILATVISKQNVRELPELAHFAQVHGFSQWYVNVEAPQNPGRDLLCLTNEDRNELQRLREKIQKTYGSSFSMLFDSAIGLPAGRSEEWIEQKSVVFCATPWQQFEVKANGDVRVCPYFHQPVCSMVGRSFSEVWNGPEYRKLRKSFATHSDIPSCCVKCNLAIKRQFLPDSPALAGVKPVGMPAWVHRSASRLKRFFRRRR